MLLFAIIALVAASSAVVRDIHCRYVDAGVVECESTHEISIESLKSAAIEVMQVRVSTTIAVSAAIATALLLIIWIGEKMDQLTSAVLAKVGAQRART